LLPDVVGESADETYAPVMASSVRNAASEFTSSGDRDPRAC
jgi:hypothetical protein